MEIETKLYDIINAANYEDICDFSVIPPENKLVTNDFFEKNGLIFCKTDFIDYLFDTIKVSNKQYALITHHSDYPIDYYRFSKKPNCIKKWFAINVEYTHSDLIPIPLGIKTHKGIYLEERYKTNWFANNIDRLRNNKKENVVYCNWSITNNDRNFIIDKLKNLNIPFILESNLSFEQYAENMSKCKYVISPPGNGMDCHRTWEALYIGCIPIVISNTIYDSWKSLPILQVNDYSNLSYSIFTDFNKKAFNTDMLYMGYWENIIKNSL